MTAAVEIYENRSLFLAGWQDGGLDWHVDSALNTGNSRMPLVHLGIVYPFVEKVGQLTMVGCFVTYTNALTNARL